MDAKEVRGWSALRSLSARCGEMRREQGLSKGEGAVAIGVWWRDIWLGVALYKDLGFGGSVTGSTTCSCHVACVLCHVAFPCLRAPCPVSFRVSRPRVG